MQRKACNKLRAVLHTGQTLPKLNKLWEGEDHDKDFLYRTAGETNKVTHMTEK